jgi:hypothetical protein
MIDVRAYARWLENNYKLRPRTMTENEALPKVSVDFGAKATLEVKAEVPRESVGRTLDALVDIIRPFTERRGLKADQIRLQRAEVAYEIARIARATAEAEHLPLSAPPTKFLVPFLEHASLEAEGAELHSHWAALLLSASTTYDARHLTYIDLLSRLSSQELRLLEEICLTDKMFPITQYPDGHVQHNERRADKIAYLFNSRDTTREKAEKIFDTVVQDHQFTYGRIMHATLGGLANMQDYYSEYGGYLQPKYPSLAILERERLVEFRRVRPSGAAAEIAYFSVSYLGVDFVRKCSPGGREAVRLNMEKALRPK